MYSSFMYAHSAPYQVGGDIELLAQQLCLAYVSTVSAVTSGTQYASTASGSMHYLGVEVF